MVGNMLAQHGLLVYASVSALKDMFEGHTADLLDAPPDLWHMCDG